MKIGLLTYYWDYNYGQYWQAVATLLALGERFPHAHVELVHVRHWGKIRNNIVTRKSLIRPWTIPAGYRTLRGYRLGRKQYYQMSSQECVTQDYEQAMRFIEAQDYDLVVVGADVILKTLPDKLVAGGVPLYWVSPEVSAKKVLLGSSADVTCLKDLSAQAAARMRESLAAMDFIGVRDLMTECLCKELNSAKVPVERTPDPTCFLRPDPAWAVAARREIPAAKTSKRRAIVHFTHRPGVEKITQNLRKRGFEVLTLGGNLPCADAAISLSPDAWAGMSTSVDLVVTMSFHESLFAVKHARPVIAIDTQPNRYNPQTGASKTRNLMDDLGLRETNHLNLNLTENFEQRLEDSIKVALSTDYNPAKHQHERARNQYQSALDTIAQLIK